jgi:hypothetical protein
MHRRPWPPGVAIGAGLRMMNSRLEKSAAHIAIDAKGTKGTT